MRRKWQAISRCGYLSLSPPSPQCTWWCLTRMSETGVSDYNLHLIPAWHKQLPGCQVCAILQEYNYCSQKGMKRGIKFFPVFCFVLLLQDFIINRYIIQQKIFTDKTTKKNVIHFDYFNQYTSFGLINSMPWHQYVQWGTFINRDTFFRAWRLCFEIQCRLVEAATVIWTAETIWV